MVPGRRGFSQHHAACVRLDRVADLGGLRALREESNIWYTLGMGFHISQRGEGHLKGAGTGVIRRSQLLLYSVLGLKRQDAC